MDLQPPRKDRSVQVRQPAQMSDPAYKNMVLRNNMTIASLTALQASLERGKELGK